MGHISMRSYLFTPFFVLFRAAMPLPRYPWVVERFAPGLIVGVSV